MDQMPGQLRLSLDSCGTIHTTGLPPVTHDVEDDDPEVASLLEARLGRSLRQGSTRRHPTNPLQTQWTRPSDR